MLQLKLLPGAMLLMLASTLSINPVSAQQSSPASGTSGMQNQMNTDMQPTTPSRANTQPVPTPMQMENQSTPDSNQMQRQQSTPRSMETTTGMVSGTIRSIEGETVTLEMADGMTKQMMVSKADLQRLNLREGMQISANLDARSMASNITVEASTATTGTEATSSQVGRTSTSTESTTSTMTTEPKVSREPTRTTTESTRTTVRSTPAKRPVRALW